MQSMEALARGNAQIALPSKRKNIVETTLGGDLRITSEFVDNLTNTNTYATGNKKSDGVVITEEAITKAAQQLAGKQIGDVDTATMHPANMVGKYHAWKIKNDYPIPGTAVVDDYRRRFLAMYASGQESVISPLRKINEGTAEIKLAVIDKYEEKRLSNSLEDIMGKIEAVVQAKEAAVKANEVKNETFEGSAEGDSLLIFKLMAARRIAEIEQMFARGDINVNVVEPGTSATGLMRASSLGLLTVVKLFLKGGADPNHQSLTGITPMHCAWDSWQKVDKKSMAKQMRFLITRDIITFLVEHGADANLASASGVTPLHMAAQFGHDDIVALLLRHGANRFIKDRGGRTPIDVARNTGHLGALGLLANWGHVEAAQTREEFRLEWDAVLAANTNNIRSRLAGTGPRGFQGLGGGSIAVLDDPRKATKLAIAKQREALFSTSNNQSAEELLRNLELQERLRLRRKEIQTENRNASVFSDLAPMQVAEYDLEKDALREVDMAKDAENIGDTNRGTKYRLIMNAPEQTLGNLPWGHKPKKEKTIEDIEREDNERLENYDNEELNDDDNDEMEQDRLQSQIDEAEEIAEAESQNSIYDSENGGVHMDGSAATVLYPNSSSSSSSSSMNVIRTPKKLIESDEETDNDSPKKPSKISTNGTDTIGNNSLQLSNSLNDSTLSFGSEATHRKTKAGKEIVPTKLGHAGNTRDLYDGGKKKKHPSRASSQSDKEDTRSDAGTAPNNPEKQGDVTAPRANVDAENAALAAQKRREVRMRWSRDTNRAVKERAERNTEIRHTLVDINSPERAINETSQMRDEGIEKQQQTKEEEEEEANKKDLRANDGLDMDLVEEKKRKEAERERLLNLYYGAPKIPKTKGKDLAERRATVANMIANDNPETMKDYTRTYGEMLLTRKPAIQSSVLRPSRLRVDNRNTIDADRVLYDGQAFQTLMAGDATAILHAGTLLNGREQSGLDGKDYGIAESITGMSGAALPTIVNSGAASFADRPDASVDTNVRALLLAKMGTSKGNVSAARVTYGSIAVNEPKLLPATSQKRAGREAVDASAPGAALLKLAESSARLLSTGEVDITSLNQNTGTTSTHNKDQTSAVQHMGGGYSKDQASRVRKLLIDARSSTETEFIQAEMLKESEDRLAGKEKVLDRNRGGYRKGDKGNQQDKQNKPELGTYGNGLLASWPLHQVGPLDQVPGRTYRDYAMLDILSGARKEHDKAVQEASNTYKRYAEARAVRASKALKTNDSIEKAGSLVSNLASKMEQAHGKAREELKKKETENAVAMDAKLRGMKETSGIPTKPDAAVPQLSYFGQESYDLIKREAPQRTLLQIIEEEADLRSSRVTRYSNYSYKDDPWKFSGKSKTSDGTKPFDYNM